MSANDHDICKAITDREDNILGAGMIENLQLVAMYVKPNVTLPKEEKFKLLVAQSEILTSIAKSTADFFGPVRYIVSSLEDSDIMFFPFISKTGDKDRILVIRTLRPCDHERIAEKVAHQLK